jgi:hypothetical protein
MFKYAWEGLPDSMLPRTGSTPQNVPLILNPQAGEESQQKNPPFFSYFVLRTVFKAYTFYFYLCIFI